MGEGPRCPHVAGGRIWSPTACSPAAAAVGGAQQGDREPSRHLEVSPTPELSTDGGHSGRLGTDGGRSGTWVRASRTAEQVSSAALHWGPTCPSPHALPPPQQELWAPTLGTERRGDCCPPSKGVSGRPFCTRRQMHTHTRAQTHAEAHARAHECLGTALRSGSLILR